MKTIYRRIVLIIIVVGSCLLYPVFGVAANSDVEYLGEVCIWLDGSTIQLGVLSFGAGHFPVHGRIISQGMNSVIPLQGTAEVDDHSINITLSSSTNLNLSTTYSIMLNSTSLAGMYQMYSHTQAVYAGINTNLIISGSFSGNAAVVPCP